MFNDFTKREENSNRKMGAARRHVFGVRDNFEFFPRRGNNTFIPNLVSAIINQEPTGKCI